MIFVTFGILKSFVLTDFRQDHWRASLSLVEVIITPTTILRKKKSCSETLLHENKLRTDNKRLLFPLVFKLFLNRSYQRAN